MFDFLHYFETCFVMGFLGVAEAVMWLIMLELVVSLEKNGVKIYPRGCCWPHFGLKVGKAEI